VHFHNEISAIFYDVCHFSRFLIFIVVARSSSFNSICIDWEISWYTGWSS